MCYVYNQWYDISCATLYIVSALILADLITLAIFVSLNNIRVSLASCSTCTVTDCGVCSWPCQWFALGEANRFLSVTSNRCIPVKSALCWSAVVFCACEVVQLSPLVFRVCRDVHKFCFRLVINVATNNWRPVFVKRQRHVFIVAHACGRICMFSPDRRER